MLIAANKYRWFALEKQNYTYHFAKDIGLI